MSSFCLFLLIPNLSLSLSLFLSLSFSLSIFLVPIPNNDNVILLFANPNGEPYHAGTSRELQCLVTSLSTHNDPNVTVGVNIVFNGSSITNNGRLSFSNIKILSGGLLRIRPLKFTYLVSSLDTGEYTCIVSVTSSIDSSYVVDSVTSRTVFFTIEGNMIIEYVLIILLILEHWKQSVK